MRIIFHIAILIVYLITQSSCSDKKRLGDWDDNIKLSSKTVEFGASSDSVTITTGGSWWWITDVSVNGAWFSHFKDIDLEADSYIIKQDCFVVERRNKNTLFIKVEENPLTIQRIITVGLEAGDYFDRVRITQKPRP